MLCGQINSVLCFFSKRDPIIKLSLLKSYCSSFYGCVLWDLSHSCINDFCVIWRKGLRRVWDLPHNTHSNLLSPLCGSLPLMDEISCRNAQFIGNCLKSDCEIVNFIARRGVYFSRMLSPIGRNAQFCSSRFSIPLNDIGTVTKNLVWAHVRSNLSLSILYSVMSLLELLFIKFRYFTLPLFSFSDIENAIYALAAC